MQFVHLLIGFDAPSPNLKGSRTGRATTTTRQQVEVRSDIMKETTGVLGGKVNGQCEVSQHVCGTDLSSSDRCRTFLGFGDEESWLLGDPWHCGPI